MSGEAFIRFESRPVDGVSFLSPHTIHIPYTIHIRVLVMAGELLLLKLMKARMRMK